VAEQTFSDLTEGLEPWSTVERLVRTLRGPVDPDDLVGRIVAEATRLVPAARDTGVIVIDPEGNLRTVVASGEAPRQLDELQMRLGTGPCLTAGRKQIVVRMHDVAADTRWATFRAAAISCDVASMLCVPLSVDEQLLGTLSFYGARPGVFRVGAEPVARALAALSALALAQTQQQARMERALHNRDLIGQAKGILMHRHGVTADAAFAMLRAHSQHANSKLVAVAERVVETGTLE
jgi:GAF domain-containing protein